MPYFYWLVVGRYYFYFLVSQPVWGFGLYVVVLILVLVSSSLQVRMSRSVSAFPLGLL